MTTPQGGVGRVRWPRAQNEEVTGFETTVHVGGGFLNQLEAATKKLAKTAL